MMKIKLCLAALALLAGAAIANAKVTPIADWNGALPLQDDDGNPVVTTCSEACAGYDLVTLICPEGEKLVECPVEGCGYYNRCEQ